MEPIRKIRPIGQITIRRIRLVRPVLGLVVLAGIAVVFWLRLPDGAAPVEAQTASWWEQNWAMAGANPQRTSWVPTSTDNQTEITGNLYPQWYRTIEPYIPYKFQVVVADDTIYVSSARGLYAFRAGDGAQKWIFPTELPLGQSPTVVNDRVYVGGLDHNLYCLDAADGKEVWVFQGNSAFETNPLIVNNTVYMGGHDGKVYAVEATSGGGKWVYQTGGPIFFSLAANSSESRVYAASNDGYVYGLSAATGALVWKSARLPGGGFHSFWPVVYRQPETGNEYVIATGTNDYMPGNGIGVGYLSNTLDANALYFNLADKEYLGPTGTVAGDWPSGTVTIDAGRVTQYLENNPNPGSTDAYPELWYKPHRRRVFVLDAENGMEFTYDSDSDGQPEYAPFAWHLTHSGNRYPAVVNGLNGQEVIYLATGYKASVINGSLGIPRGGIVGWKFGTKYLSLIHQGGYGVVDEPLAAVSGGKMMYWSLCCDREAGGYDLTKPYGSSSRYWVYYSLDASHPEKTLAGKVPGYDVRYPDKFIDTCAVFGQENGIYGTHGVQNPPIPYKGRLYMLRGNSLIAFGPDRVTPAKMTDAASVAVTRAVNLPSKDYLKQRLIDEVRKILDAGHLRPGYRNSGNGARDLNKETYSYLIHYFHNPGETLMTLAQTMAYLPASMQAEVRGYLETEYSVYGDKVHSGWQTGAAREIYLTPPEILADMENFEPLESIYGAGTWDKRFGVYGWWKYAETLNDNVLAGQLFNQARPLVGTSVSPEDDTANWQPYISNAFIAGYVGYINLGKMAGYVETSSQLSGYVAELNRLLAQRAGQFATTPGGGGITKIARNFMYMVPELADYLGNHAQDKVRTAVASYNVAAPYWPAASFDNTSGEGTMDTLFNTHALFQAKARILKEDYPSLVKYLDVPAFARGDLYYLQNLVAALEAPGEGSATPTPVPGVCPGDVNGDRLVNLADFRAVIDSYGDGAGSYDINDNGRVNAPDLVVVIREWGRCP